MPTAGRPVRLDTVARRRDGFFVATAPALVTVLMLVLMWPLVLGICWDLLGLPWLSLVPGLAGTVAVVRWGSRNTRVARAEAGALPRLVVTADELQVANPDGPGLARIPLDAIRVVAIDQPPRRQRRADKVRFAVYGADGHPVGWLYCRDGAALRTLGRGFEKTPNLAVIFSRRTPIGAGLLAAVTDPDAARAAFTGRVPVRPLTEADLDGVCAPGSLPVLRHGRHGLREVQPWDRIRARIFDAFAIEVLFFLLVPWLAPPGHNQLPGMVAAFTLAWFLYEVPLSALTGQTLGKVLVGLRVVRVEDGSARIGLGRATARSLLRLLNGLAGPFNRFVEGDVLGRLAPRLSLINGVGAGTVVVTDGEYRRLRSRLSAEERERALTETLLDIETLEPTVTTRAAGISLAVALLLGIGYLAGLIWQGGSDGTRRLDPPRPVVDATPSPRPLLPTAPVLPSRPAPSPVIPLPSFDWGGAVGG